MMLFSVFVKQRAITAKIGTVNLVFNRTAKCLSQPLQEIRFTKSFVLERQDSTVQSSAYLWRNISTTPRKCFLSKDEYEIVDPAKKKKDKIPEQYEMIYESDLSVYAFGFAFGWFVVFMLVSSTVAVLTYIFGYEMPEYLGMGDTNLIKTSYAIPPAVLLTFLFTMLPIIRLHRNLVKRIYWDKTTDEFIAIMKKNFFQTETVSFKKNEAVGLPPDRNKNRYSNFRIKGKKCHVYEKDFAKFRHLHFYNQWFGYDDTE